MCAYFFDITAVEQEIQQRAREHNGVEMKPEVIEIKHPPGIYIKKLLPGKLEDVGHQYNHQARYSPIFWH